MRFCISITNEEALKKWHSIPKQKRSKFIEDALLNKNSNTDEIKSMLLELINKSDIPTDDVILNKSAIDEILNL